eukprot:g1469.t1
MSNSFLTLLRTVSLATLVFASEDNNSWKRKYEERFGAIEIEHRKGKTDALEANPFNATTTNAIVDEWSRAQSTTACPCKVLDEHLVVWTNGLLTRSEEFPFQDSDYENLYRAALASEQIASIVRGHGLSSESDYAFAVFSLKFEEGEELNAASVSKSMGFEKILVPNKPLSEGKYDDDTPVTSLPKAIEHMRTASKDGVVVAYQTTDAYFCDGFAYIVNPTLIISQLTSDLVFGLLSTAIYT